MPKSHPQTAITLRLDETDSPQPIARISKERSVLQGIRFTKPQTKEARTKPEMDTPGVYFLWARPEDIPESEDSDEGAADSSRLVLYIGSSDDPEHRFTTHSGKGATWLDWTDAALFTTANNEIDGKQAEYAEKRLIELAAKLKKAELRNEKGKKKAEEGKSLKLPNLGDGAKAEADYFYRELLQVLPLIGIHAFISPTGIDEDEDSTELSTEIEGSENLLFLDLPDTKAEGRQLDNGFVVFEGALGRAEPAPAFAPPMSAAVRRLELIEQGVLVEQDGQMKLTQDWLFSSASSAASVLAAGSKAGPKEWKNKDGVSLKKLEAAIE